MKIKISIIVVSLFATGLLFSSAVQNAVPAIARYEPGSVHAPVNRDDTVIFNEDFGGGIPAGWNTSDVTNPGSYWYPSFYNAYGDSGHSWRLADESVGPNGGYLDGWYQILDTPIITLPAAGNLVLSFEQFRSIEEPGTYLAFDGWDGLNVRIRLENQDYTEAVILTDCNPAYNCTSLYSFGAVHQEDEDGIPGIPGWGGSVNWTTTTINLPSVYQGQNVIISFAFASDEYTSTATNAEFTGIFIDEIDVAGVFFNNAENTTGFHGFTNTPVGGNLWHVYQDENAPSPPAALGCFDADTGLYNPGMKNYITTSNIILPAAGNIYLDMDIKAAFDDYLFPDCDYFSLEVSHLIVYFGAPFWSEWHSVSNPGGAPNLPNVVFTGTTDGWTTFSEGWPGFNDLSVLHGKTVKFRIGMHSNNDFNVAAGIRIDDFRIISSTSAGIPPQNLSAELNQDYSVTLSWSSVADNVSTYNVYRGPHPNALTLIIPACIDTVFTDADPVSDHVNFYAVSANLTTGETGLSEPVQVFVPSASAAVLAYDDGGSESGFNAGSLNSFAVLFEPDYSRTEQTVTHIQFYVENMNSGAVVLCGWQNNAGSPGSILAGFPVSLANSQVVAGWNTYTVPVAIRPQFNSGSFFFGINEFVNLPAIGFDEDSAGNSYVRLGGWNALPDGNLMIRVIVDSDPALAEDLIVSERCISLSNYPNPFNPSTTIRLNLPQTEKIRLDIYNMKGQLIKSLINETLPAGLTLLEWNGTDDLNKSVASGIYLCKLQSDNQIKINKMLLLK